jgi:glycosyltransferase involved in cell wall biosynthesis
VTLTRRLVVSAVNLTEGGTLTVLRDFVAAACKTLPPEWELVVFVHSRGLLDAPRARLIEIPDAKGSWLRRIWTEWYRFRKYARELQPDLWLSLSDTSPSVGAVPQAVYCHNPNPFFPVTARSVLFQPTQLVFRVLYPWLYRINLRRNRAIVVQQEWLRAEFRKWTGDGVRIIVAHPSAPQPIAAGARERGRRVFIYPTLSRPFKNIELIGRAVQELERSGSWDGEVIVTVDGTENRYARWLQRRFGSCRTLHFAGRQTREQMQSLYARADCLLFPSWMETWGLPITEAKQFGLPMLVADLPYARETVGNYERVEFIDVHDPHALAAKMRAFREDRLPFVPAMHPEPRPPFVWGWSDLVRELVESGATGRG